MVWSLRRYQIEALRAISAGWQSADRLAIVMATGTGKTTVMAEIALRRKKAGRGRALLIAHRLELLQQAKARFERCGLSVEIESGEGKAQIRSMWPSDVVVATIQTLKGRRLEAWPKDSFGTIMIDECHHATSASYRAVLDYFEGYKLIGVTATPDRGDKVALGHVIPVLAYEYSLRAAIEDGFLVPIRARAIDMPTVDMSSVRTTQQEHGRDLSAEDLARVMSGEEALHQMAAPIGREAGARQHIGFVPSVEIAHEMARIAGGYLGGALAEALDGGSSDQRRAEVLANYNEERTRALYNCALFTEGFDAPKTACVAVARPTKSRPLYAQMVGRGTRPDPSVADRLSDPRLTPEERRAIIEASVKPFCLILDLAPQNMRHELVAPVDLLLGGPLPDDELKAARAAMGGDDVLAVLASTEKRAQEIEAKRARDRGRVVARVDYRLIERDPFAELGISVRVSDRKGPRASEEDVQRIQKAGLELLTIPSRSEAKRLLGELANRRRRGLCTVKQMRTLASRGLSKDLSFEQAKEALDALAAARWRMTPEIAERWGQPTVDPAEDFDR